MVRLFPTECLNEILENLEEDINSLHSCLLVNRLWCEISVRILWRDNWKYSIKYRRRYPPHANMTLGIIATTFDTLIACLPNESKELFHKYGIFISMPTSNPPTFNYPSFCKVLSIDMIGHMVDEVLKRFPYNNTPNTSLCKKDRDCLIMEEMVKMFMNQISSLKKLTYVLRFYQFSIPNNVTFTYIPGWLTDLSELHCSSNVNSKFFYQLSQKCHNLQSLVI